MGFLDSLLGSSSSSKTKESMNKTTTGNQQDLSAEALAQLESLFGNILSDGNFQAGQDATLKRIREVDAFDADAFAQSITAGAASAAGIDLESGINGLASSVGGSKNSNSMLAMLDSKLRNQTAANLGSVSSQARLDAEKFKSDGINDGSNTLNSQILQLIAGTRGANTSGQIDEVGSSKSKTKGSGTQSLGSFITGVANAIF